MWFPQSLVFLSQPNILLMKAEVMKMIRLHDEERSIMYFLSATAEFDGMLMHHENVCSLWPDVSHCITRKKHYTFLIIFLSQGRGFCLQQC